MGCVPGINFTLKRFCLEIFLVRQRGAKFSTEPAIFGVQTRDGNRFFEDYFPFTVHPGNIIFYKWCSASMRLKFGKYNQRFRIISGHSLWIYDHIVHSGY